ncbi:MAG: L-aspartate oxidase [Cyanobacteria bacterium J06641_5]
MSASLAEAKFDVLVIGAGAAGLYAALCLPARYRVGLLTKGALKLGASRWAQGGIAAAIQANDSPELHLEDTLKAGAGLCEPDAVNFLVAHANDAIANLVDMGVAFDRHNGQLATTLEAAHSRPRVLHAADTTGKAIVDTLIERVRDRPNIEIVSRALALKLWLHPDTGRCQGASVLHENQICWLHAAAVVLATGGGGQVFAQTTNPSVSTGDGVALAWRAGATIRDPEFFQFHPTALTISGAPRFLISEAVRGEGAHLIDDRGDRFTCQYHPAGELAPRDAVSRAIFHHLQANAANAQTDPNYGRVWLDLSPIERERAQYRFPNILRVCRDWGIDALEQPIPVAPAAHYWMGGIVTDLHCRTGVPGLLAIGETASTGVHGANRLASNSLLECLVFAAQLGTLKLAPLAQNVTAVRACELGDWSQQLDAIATIRQQLPALMWQSAGIVRERDALERALARVTAWRTELAGYEPIASHLHAPIPNVNVAFRSPHAELQLRLAAETLNLIDVAHGILQGALQRQESRGGHYRRDFPTPLASWQQHTTIVDNSIELRPIERHFQS